MEGTSIGDTSYINGNYFQNVKQINSMKQSNYLANLSFCLHQKKISRFIINLKYAQTFLVETT